MIVLALLPMSRLYADEVIGDAQRRAQVQAKLEQEKLQRLRGWKRIVFGCYPPTKAPAKEMFERICDRTSTNLKFLATTANVNVRVARDAQELGYWSAFGGMLQLEVDLYYAGCKSSDCAVHAVVTASFPYDQGVDLKARSYPIFEDDDLEGPERPTDSPAATPRPIEAVIWGPRQVTTAGYAGQEMAAATAGALDEILKQFFTDYVQANRD